MPRVTSRFEELIGFWLNILAQIFLINLYKIHFFSNLFIFINVDIITFKIYKFCQTYGSARINSKGTIIIYYSFYNKIRNYLMILLEDVMYFSNLLKYMEDVLDYMISDLLDLLLRIMYSNFGEIILYSRKKC